MWEAWVEAWTNSLKDVRSNVYIDKKYHFPTSNSPSNNVMKLIFLLLKHRSF